MAAAKKRVIVVGGGLAGLSCSVKLAEEGVGVDQVEQLNSRFDVVDGDAGGVTLRRQTVKEQQP